MVPILFGVTLITFLLFNVAGGDPAAQMAGKNATPERIEEIRALYGFDQPLHLQYVDFLRQIATFDYGRSISSKQKISTMIFGDSPELSPVLTSLSMTLPAFILTLLITISIALVLTVKRGTRLDTTVMVVCLALMSFSSLVYILYGQYALGYQLGLFEISGWDPSWTERWRYLALPIVIFVILSLGTNILFYRTIFLEEIFQDYVRTAKSKGLDQKKILFKHVLRNAMIPIITLVVIQMPFLILGALLIEAFFGIPGLGGLIFQALNESDFPVIRAMTVMITILYMVFQLITDVLYSVVDPKVTLK
jgi:peptide/nickel transport system permease protein